MDSLDLLSRALEGGIGVLLAVLVLYWLRREYREQLRRAARRERRRDLRIAREQQEKMYLLEIILNQGRTRPRVRRSGRRSHKASHPRNPARKRQQP